MFVKSGTKRSLPSIERHMQNIASEKFNKKGDFSDVQAAYALIKTGTEKLKSIDEEMTSIMNSVSVIQQKRLHAERESSKKKLKLTID